MRAGLAELRAEPTEKRVRALIAGRAVVDSTRAMLVWEPRRVVPSYAVPVDEVRAELVPAELQRSPEPPILHPGIPFAVHSAGGEAYGLRVDGQVRDQAAFRPADPDLAAYVVLDFQAFDEWLEEDERLLGHPRDPFHRIDIRHSSQAGPDRARRAAAGGERAAGPGVRDEPAHPLLPPARGGRRGIAPRAPSGPAAPTRARRPTGRSTAPRTSPGRYESPFGEAAALTGLVAFFDELVDVTLDGERRERPRTEFSRALLEEAGVQP